MFSRSAGFIWIGILALSAMFLNGCPCVDTDGDGYGATANPACTYPELDCDDANADVYPGAPELCDGQDNDCDTVVPEDEEDTDDDGYVECSPWVGDAPEIIGGNDCEDHDNLWSSVVYPSAPEICDGIDNHCPGDVGYDEIDEGCAPDGWKYVFLSETSLTGSMGGIENADAICNSDAAANGLPGTYLAWLATSFTNPAVRFTRDAKWRMVNLQPVAYSIWDLANRNWRMGSGNWLRHAIDVLPSGSSSVKTVWTGIAPGEPLGSSMPGETQHFCNDWQTDSDDHFAAVGDSSSAEDAWTHVPDEEELWLYHSCGWSHRVYCFQQ